MVSSRTHLVCLCATRTRDCAPGWAVECAGRGHEAAQPGTGHVRRRRLHRPARAEPSRAEPRGPFEARVEPTDGTRSARASGGQRDEHGMAMSVKYRTDVHTTRRGRRGVDRRPVRGGVTIARTENRFKPSHRTILTVQKMRSLLPPPGLPHALLRAFIRGAPRTLELPASQRVTPAPWRSSRAQTRHRGNAPPNASPRPRPWPTSGRSGMKSPREKPEASCR